MSPQLTWQLYLARWSPKVVHLSLLMRMNEPFCKVQADLRRGPLAQSPS